MKLKPIAGVSLVEVMVALAVLGIVLSLALPSFADMIERRRVIAVATDVGTDLAYARAESGLQANEVMMFFGQDSSLSCYTIAIKDPADAGCDCTRSGRPCDRSSEMRTSKTPISRGVILEWTGLVTSGRLKNRFSFTSPQMTPSRDDFQLTVKGARTGASLRLSVSPLGRVSTCSPDGKISGYRVC